MPSSAIFSHINALSDPHVMTELSILPASLNSRKCCWATFKKPHLLRAQIYIAPQPHCTNCTCYDIFMNEYATFTSFPTLARKSIFQFHSKLHLFWFTTSTYFIFRFVPDQHTALPYQPPILSAHDDRTFHIAREQRLSLGNL